MGQFPAPIQPWPLAWILSDGIFDGFCKFGGQHLCIFLLVRCQFHFDGGITRNARIEKANEKSPKKSPSQYFIFLEKVFGMEDQHIRSVDQLVST